MYVLLYTTNTSVCFIQEKLDVSHLPLVTDSHFLWADFVPLRVCARHAARFQSKA